MNDSRTFYCSLGGSLWGPDAIVAGIQVGLMAVNMLAVNNLRDIEVDTLAKKRTLSVRLGYRTGRWQLVVQTTIAYLIGIRWLMQGSPLAFILPSLTAPLAWIAISKVFREEPSSSYNNVLGFCGGLHVLYCSLLAVGLACSDKQMN